MSVNADLRGKGRMREGGVRGKGDVLNTYYYILITVRHRLP